jgi:hypothetical protein
VIIICANSVFESEEKTAVRLKSQPKQTAPKARPSDDQDSAWKEMLDEFLPAFLAFFFPEIERDIDWSRKYQPLDKELAQLRPDFPGGKLYADKLFKVWLKNGKVKWILIHIDIQGRAGRGFTRRVFVYNFRIGAKYPGSAVVSLVVITETKRRVVARYEVSNWGCSLVFQFPSVQLADFAARWAELEKSDNIFAVAVMAQLKALETRGDNQRRFVWKRRLIEGLYKRGYERHEIVALLKFMDWAMRLPASLEQEIKETVRKIEEGKKMPYVTSWERMAKHEGVYTSVILLFEHRFGELSEALRVRLKKLSTEQLQALVVAQLDFKTKSDLHAWLKQHAPANGASRHGNSKPTKRASK